MSQTLTLQEPFASLWAGQDAFAAVEALQGRVAALEALLRARGFEVRCVPSRHAPATDWMLYARRSPAHSDTPTPDVGGAAAR